MNRIDLVLVDFDDTLVVTEPRFQDARRALFERLAAAGYDAEVSRHIHETQVDPEMLAQFGLGPHRLEHSFRETYLRVCLSHGAAHEELVAEECARLGRAVAGAPEPIPGALEALARLAAEFPTLVYTQAGDREYQLRCLRECGILDVLPAERVCICERKTAAEFLRTVTLHGADPAASWMIGNSVRSDINPALESGARAILVGSGPTWSHEHAEPVSPDYLQVDSFMTAVEHLHSLRTGSAACK